MKTLAILFCYFPIGDRSKKAKLIVVTFSRYSKSFLSRTMSLKSSIKGSGGKYLPEEDYSMKTCWILIFFASRNFKSPETPKKTLIFKQNLIPCSRLSRFFGLIPFFSAKALIVGCLYLQKCSNRCSLFSAQSTEFS